MNPELILNFAAANQLTVSFAGESSGTIAFQSPFSEADLQEVRWYLEQYAAQYGTEIEDDRAARVTVRLKQWGTELYRRAVMADPDGGAARLFAAFLDEQEAGRVLTVRAVQPEILALPWELLHVPGGAYVFNERPRISIRRNLAGTRGGRAPKRVTPKAALRLLMVVSRPTDAGFIDPRGEAQAVLAAIARQGAGRIAVEFLRPATLKALEARLEDEALPAIDILHFDGHGVFDATGAIAAGKAADPSLPGGWLKGEGANTGYLLFEQADGTRDLVPAERLGEILHQQGLGLVVLSACQSAAVAGEEAIGSVAARLTQTGVPSVVAMSYSVLVTTTQRLFDSFYEHLVQGKGVGASLDNARRQLLLNPDRGERVRNGSDRITLRLEDWFVPTLYQSGVDIGLVAASLAPEGSPLATLEGDLGGSPTPRAGFFGRRRELWEIEQAFVRGRRRVTSSGFGGQGKTALAIEVGRWLQQTGMFDAVCFVDYAGFQGVDALGWAVSRLAVELGENFIDGLAVRSRLAQQRVLVLLDNLEDVEAAAQQTLLTAAVAWSEAGASRVLVTTRQGDLGHPGYPAGGDFKHQRLELKGLGSAAYPDDAIDLCRALWAVPSALGEVPQPLPARSALVHVLTQVEFHPLSIALVVEQLKARRVAAVGEALARLLAAVPAGQSKDKCLIASLNLSLERLGTQERQWVQRLGVFAGGAFEDNLLAITEFTAEQWQPLRRQLEGAGLVTAEVLPNITVPYLKFHPTLAPVLWGTLAPAEQQALKQRHQERYYNLSGWLYQTDSQNPLAVRAIARRELPNLLTAVQAALAAADENAVDFVDNVNWFLDFFGMNQDRQRLTDQAQAIAGVVGSPSWFLSRSNAGDQLWQAGQLQAALSIFEDILQGLGTAIRHDRCLTLGKIGRCWAHGGQPERAATTYRQALAELGQLTPADGVKRLMGATQADLGDVLRALGAYGEARSAYEASLSIAQELGDDRQIAVVNGQLGTLALRSGNLPEAEQRYREAITQFQSLGEPATEAIYWHQLGRAYEEANAWEAAQAAYRQSAAIKEQQGMLGGYNGVETTWNQLAMVLEKTGNFPEAEAYYRKAIAAVKQVGELAIVSAMLNNLADLLQTQGDAARLAAAQQLAEEALALGQTLDPAAAQIWNTYTTLAKIALQQGDQPTARGYRRQARQSYAAFAGSQYELQQHEGLMQAVVAAIQDGSQLPELEERLQSYLRAKGWGDLVAALRRLLAGERDENELCEDLDGIDSLIVGAVLQRLG
jgi:tetratricopeptide (TPR) repeat protein